MADPSLQSEQAVTTADNAPLPPTEAESDAASAPTADAAPETAPADAAPETAPADAAPESAPADAGQDSAGGLQTGMLVTGTIVSTSVTSIIVDVGEGRTGIVPSAELERMNRPTIEALKPGESITVFVVKAKDHEGRLILSINRAVEEKDWLDAEEFRRSQGVFESRIAGYNKGGLIVRFGRLRGFVPQSQIASERRASADEQLSAMVNEPILVKVMEVDRVRNRLILSERAATRESREKRKENLIAQLTIGEIRDGRVVSLEDFGVFVDIGGAEGLVHLTELSWQHVTHPRELVAVGQQVRVEVISIDKQNKRIGLSMRQLEADPWDRIASTFTVGQLVQARVTKLTKFGAFAQLVDLPEIEGLIHISELSDKRVQHPREVVAENDKLTLRVVKIDIKSRRLGLSLKRVNSAEYLDLDWSLSTGEAAPPVTFDDLETGDEQG